MHESNFQLIIQLTNSSDALFATLDSERQSRSCVFVFKKSFLLIFSIEIVVDLCAAFEQLAAVRSAFGVAARAAKETRSAYEAALHRGSVELGQLERDFRQAVDDRYEADSALHAARERVKEARQHACMFIVFFFLCLII